jgi:hypothetical protein
MKLEATDRDQKPFDGMRLCARAPVYDASAAWWLFSQLVFLVWIQRMLCL